MLVRSLNVEEFRGIKKCKESIQLSSFTVLIGRNNSGKSTILEALSLLPTPQIQDYLTNQNKINSVKKLHRSKYDDNKSLLYLYAGSSNIQFTINKKVLNIQITENESQLFINGKKDWDELTLSKIFQVEPQSLIKSIIFIPNDTSIISEMESKMESQKELIMKRGYHVSVAKNLSDSVDDIYSEIVFLTPISIRKVIPGIPAGNYVYLELRDLGAGAEKAVKLMSLIEAIDPKLLLIDDFGAGLHPSLIKILLKWFKDKKWQTVISTHNLDVLYSLVEVNPDDTTILQLYKSDEDILDYKILTLEEIEDLLNANVDPRSLIDALHL